MEYTELQGNTNVDILQPKVKVNFLSRLGDSKLSNTYLPVFIYYQLLLCYVLNLLLIIDFSEESVVSRICFKRISVAIHVRMTTMF